ncbi:MAG TPA: glycosyltransferase family 2 protein [Nocardioidaceae bacterium]
MEDLVSVVIPAYDEEAFLGHCLDSVRAQDYPNLEIIVVNGPSRDGTADVVRARTAVDDRVHLVHNPRRSIPSSMNLGVHRARGRWLVRVDAHSTIDPSYVRIAVDRLREGTWAGVGGRKEGVGRTPAGRAISVAMSSRLGVGNSTYHFGTSAQEVDHLPFGAYSLEVVRAMGGWNEDLVANEDFEFDHRLLLAGHRLLFDPRMVIHWHCRQSVVDLYRQYRRYGMGKVDVVWLHPGSLNPRHVVPPAFVAYAAVGLLVTARRPRRWLGMLAPYAAAVAVESVRAGRSLGRPRERLSLPAAFVAMHVGWGVGFWLRLAQTLPRHARQALPGSRGRELT